MKEKTTKENSEKKRVYNIEQTVFFSQLTLH